MEEGLPNMGRMIKKEKVTSAKRKEQIQDLIKKIEKS